MGFDPITLMAVATVASVGSAAMGAKAQHEAAQDQKDANRAQTTMEIERNKKEARQTLRQQRIASAMIAVQSQNAGGKGSSGEAGAMGSGATQGATAQGWQGSLAQHAQNQSNLAQSIINKQDKAQMWGTASNIFATGANFAGKV